MNKKISDIIVNMKKTVLNKESAVFSQPKCSALSSIGHGSGS